jgi:hypothetical protein
MDIDPAQVATTTSTAQVAVTADAAQDASTATTFPAEYVQQLRQEAASYRTKLREIEDATKRANEERLAQEAKWQELAEQRAKEIEELRPYQERYAAMLEALKAGNEKRLEQIPDGMRSLVPPIDDPATLGQWLDANWSILTGKPLAPSMNGGAGTPAPRTSTVVLTDSELAMAAKMGITPEQYLAAKTKRGK